MDLLLGILVGIVLSFLAIWLGVVATGSADASHDGRCPDPRERSEWYPAGTSLPPDPPPPPPSPK